MISARCILHTESGSFPLVPNKSNSFEDFYVQLTESTDQFGQTRIEAAIHPKKTVTLRYLELAIPIQLDETSRFLANGFQSWSETLKVRPDQPIYRLHWLAKPYLKQYDDTHLLEIFNHRRLPHAWTFTSINHSDGVQFLGSLSEKTGFTLIEMDESRSELIVKKDLMGLELSHSFPALSLLFCKKDTEKAAFEAYFQAFELLTAAQKKTGLAWTSWYYFYENIDEPKLLSALAEVVQSEFPFKLFQIDDGWQSAIGDWMKCNEKFPNGLRPIVAETHKNGLQAGLWLAPFCASPDSFIFQKHPDWLLKDAKGKPLKIGKNPAWGGWYYALDFYHPAVREYLSGVFHTVFRLWGFDMVKLDFLFAIAIAPPKGKTRGQVMHEAMEWLRQLCQGKTLLACGVPLGSAFGLADVCRIGGDVGFTWENRSMRYLGHRGRISTIASLHSTLNRWALNGQTFLNDPDVFILRKKGVQMSAEEKKTLLFLNALLGGVLFTSDLPISNWSASDKSLLWEALENQGSTIHSVEELQKDVYQIEGAKPNGEAFCLTFSL